MYKENRKCKHGRLKEICCECKRSQICEHNKRRSRVKIVAEVKFVNTIGRYQGARIVVGVKFVRTTREDQYVRTAAEVKFGSTTRKDQSAPHAIPLDTLLGLYEAVFILF